MSKADSNRSYGWVVVLVSFCILAVSTGTILSFGVFLKPLLAEFGWTRGQTSLAYSLNWIVFGLFSPIFGALSDRFNTRAVVLAGGIIYGAGMLLTTQTRALGQLYVFFGVMTGMGMSAFFAPLTAMVMKWAGRRSGLAVGLISSGTGMGTFVLPPVARYLISHSGWEGAFAVLGIVSLAVILPASLLLRDNEPGKDRPKSGLDSHPHGMRARKGRPWDILRGGPFWHLFFINFLCCASHSVPLLHVVSYATDMGVPQMVAASILSLAGATSIVGRIGMGAIADRMGVRRMLVAALSMQGGMIFWLLGAQATWTFYTFAVFFGIAYGGVMPLYAVLAREYYHEEVVGSIYGGILLGATLGMALGGFLGGAIFDATGSYSSAYILSLGVGALAVAMAALLRSPTKSPIEIQRTVVPTLTPES